MKFPWRRRADEERRQRERAEERLRLAERDWQQIRAEVEVTRSEQHTNGWTATVTTIFSGH